MTMTMTMTTPTANLDKFRQVYADAVIHDMSDEQWQTASKIRELNWHGELMSLAEAAEAYATICDGYNEFQPDMLANLLAKFPDAGIEVTPARESSVAVYLHVPTVSLEAVITFVEANWKADEVDEDDKGKDGLRVWWD